MYKPLNMFTKQTDELKQLISEHPDLPIVVIAANEGVADDYYGCIGEILDCEQDIDKYTIYTDRYDLEQDIAGKLGDSGNYDETTDDEFDAIVKAELAKYEPYWKKVIQIRADL